MTRDTDNYPMFSHVIVGVNDVARATTFYDAVLAILGHQRRWGGESGAGYGTRDALGIDTFWLTQPYNEQTATAGNGANVAFMAATRAQVRAFHAKALEMGGVCDGAPGIRAHAHENFYAAYVLDPDGNKIVAVCHASGET